jgi:dipeptidyl aminopeptidase/acylaminoacyl peptidase
MNKKFKSAYIFACASLVFGCNATATKTDSSKGLVNAPYAMDTISPAQPKRGQGNNIENNVQLSMEQIMSDPDWLGRQPQSAYFSPMGDNVLYFRKREGSVVQDLYKTNSGMGNGEIVALGERHEQEFDEIINDNDHNFVAWIYEGNVFTQGRNSDQVVQLTKDSDRAHNLKYYGKTSVSFQKGNGFYAIDTVSGQYSQIFEWKFAENKPAVEPPEDYIAQEQQKLIKYVQVQRKNAVDRRSQQDALESQNSTVMANTFYFDKGDTNVLASLSPDGKYAIVVTRENKPNRTDGDIMPDYIEENGRIKAQSVRQRVADAKPQSHSIFFLDIVNNTQKELSYKSLPGYNEDVLADVKRENAEAKGETYTNNRLPRDIGLLFDWYATEMPVKWHDSGEHVALMLEAWDNKDRWIVTVDVKSPKFTTQHRMHDKAWVNYRFNQFGWFDEEKSLYLLSEESGYSQLYTKAIDGDLKALSAGRFVVDNVVLSKDDQYFYYKANKKHPGIYEVYRVNAQGGESEALTNLNGMTDFELSPNEDVLLLTHSSLAMPPELYLKSIGAETKASKLTSTVSEAFLSIDWAVPAIVPIKSSNTEQPIYSRVYTPQNTGTTEKRRAVVFNHGAGYLQNAHLGWSGYFREFMFHSLLVSQGYVVLDMDFRASAGYGRDWRTAIYRNMGTPEVQDLKDGVEWLVENANVDRERIGTYGGSYGGFLTFMALFNEPELFQAGAALRPVSDWAHYNLPYTANILNTPDVDPLAYERSSPIYFAEGLTKPLLMNAPMVDNNVFFVDVVRLVQRLIELEKEDFETAIYPVEPHGFVQPSSWLDEYRRIHKLFETNL